MTTLLIQLKIFVHHNENLSCHNYSPRSSISTD